MLAIFNSSGELFKYEKPLSVVITVFIYIFSPLMIISSLFRHKTYINVYEDGISALANINKGLSAYGFSVQLINVSFMEILSVDTHKRSGEITIKTLSGIYRCYIINNHEISTLILQMRETRGLRSL
jgi:hypothetical protein